MAKLKITDGRRIYTRMDSQSGFPSLLTLLFIGLKLTGYIDWSWIWVLSPIWICWSLAFILLVVVSVLDTD